MFLQPNTKNLYQRDWGTIREALANHFLNRSWFNTQRACALKARYRQVGYSDERPTDYLYRKVNLLNTISEWTPLELITEVMRGAPSNWDTILGTANMATLEELANALEYYNDQLIRLGSHDDSAILSRLRNLERSLGSSSKHKARANEVETQEVESEVEAEVKLISRKPFAKKKSGTTNFNSSNKTKPPPADHVVSKGKTPMEAGGRPCRHCNSGKHWDYDCPHSNYHKNRTTGKFKKQPFQRKFKRFKHKFQKAQTKFVHLDDQAWDAYACFEETNLYSESSDSSSNSSSESQESSESEDQLDF